MGRILTMQMMTRTCRTARTKCCESRCEGRDSSNPREWLRENCFECDLASSGGIMHQTSRDTSQLMLRPRSASCGSSFVLAVAMDIPKSWQ
eukprot:scaffold183879_cov43-Tisochrysis_lutea.AAC.2